MKNAYEIMLTLNRCLPRKVFMAEWSRIRINVRYINKEMEVAK